jgi:hypothetical protein
MNDLIRGVDPAMAENAHIEEALKEDGIELLTVIGADDQHARNDIRGDSIFLLDRNSPVMRGAEEVLRKMKLIPEGGGDKS